MHERAYPVHLEAGASGVSAGDIGAGDVREDGLTSTGKEREVGWGEQRQLDRLPGFALS